MNNLLNLAEQNRFRQNRFTINDVINQLNITGEEEEYAENVTEDSISQGPEYCDSMLDFLSRRIRNSSSVSEDSIRLDSEYYDDMLDFLSRQIRNLSFDSEVRQSMITYIHLRQRVMELARQSLMQSFIRVIELLSHENILDNTLSTSLGDEAPSSVPPMEEQSFEILRQLTECEPYQGNTLDLRKITVSETCTICLSSIFESGDDASGILCSPCGNCSHSFHVNCLRTHFLNKSECPTCREQWSSPIDENIIASGIARKVVRLVTSSLKLQQTEPGGDTFDSLFSLLTDTVNLQTFLANPHFKAISCWKNMFSIAGFVNDDDGVHISLRDEEARQKAKQFVDMLREAWGKK